MTGYDEARKALKTHAQMYFNVYLEKGGRILHEVLSRRIRRGPNLQEFIIKDKQNQNSQQSEIPGDTPKAKKFKL